LHFLRRAGDLRGRKVLIIGAGGGIGAFAVQLAKHFGAEVTGVDRSERLDLLRSIGADRVIDYTREDFTQRDECYDVIFDVVGKTAFSARISRLNPQGRYLWGNPGPSATARGLGTSMRGGRKVIRGASRQQTEDLVFLRELIEEGRIRTVIDQRFPLEEIADAHRYFEGGVARGGVVITLYRRDPHGSRSFGIRHGGGAQSSLEFVQPGTLGEMGPEPKPPFVREPSLAGLRTSVSLRFPWTRAGFERYRPQRLMSGTPVGGRGVRMRKVVTDHLLSLDGYFGGPNGEIDWFGFDEESMEWSRKIMGAAGSIVMGRRTFELMAKFWPTQSALDQEPFIAEHMTKLPKIVFSRTVDSSTWKNTKFVTRPVAETIREEKEGTGGSILILGSSIILAPLWREHLVDEVNVRIQPIVVGKGRPLFAESEVRQPLSLKESRVFQSGVTALRYEVLPAPA